MASRYSLRGTDRFPKDLLPDPVLKGVRRHKIHRGLKKVLEVVFQADEIEQADRLRKIPRGDRCRCRARLRPAPRSRRGRSTSPKTCQASPGWPQVFAIHHLFSWTDLRQPSRSTKEEFRVQNRTNRRKGTRKSQIVKVNPMRGIP